MTTFVTKLNPYPLSADTPIRRLTPPPPERVNLHDPAVKVMTDLRPVLGSLGGRENHQQ